VLVFLSLEQYSPSWLLDVADARSNKLCTTSVTVIWIQSSRAFRSSSIVFPLEFSFSMNNSLLMNFRFSTGSAETILIVLLGATKICCRDNSLLLEYITGATEISC
jgi:hypothetical protein